MSLENNQFEIISVERAYQDSGEINSAPKKVDVGIKSMRVRCTQCGAEWWASEGTGRGQFLEGVGGDIRVVCEGCEQEATVSNRPSS